MKTEYILKVSTADFYKIYKIKANDLSQASKSAKIKFGKEFSLIGKDIKVSIDPSDVANHIREIIDRMRG